MLQNINKKISSRTGLQFDFVHGFAWNHAAKIAEYVLLYVFSVIVARSLGPQTNGEYATLLSIAQLLLTFSSIAFDLALNRFLPHLSGPNQEANTVYLVRRLLLIKIVFLALFGSALLFGWESVRHWFDVQSPVAGYMVFVVALSFVRAISSTLSSVWVSRLKPKIIFFVNTSILLLQIVAVIMVIGNGHELHAVLLIVLFGSSAITLAYALLGRRYIIAPAEKIPMKPVFSFAGWLWVNALTMYIYGKQGDIMMLSFFSVSKASIGFYDVAYSLSFLPSMMFSAGLGGITVSMFSRLSKEQPSDLPRFWTSLSSFLTQITVPVYCFLAVFAGNIIALLYSGEYAQSVQFLQVFIIARIISRLFGGGESFDALINIKAERSAVALSTAGSAMNFLLNLLLIPQFQALGAVLATSMTTIVVDCSMWILLKRRASVPLLFGNWLRSLLIGLAPVIIMRLIFPSPSALQLMLSALFCILVWMTGILVFSQLSKSSGSTLQTK